MKREELVKLIFLKITRNIENLLIVAILENEDLENMYYKLYNII